MNLSPVPMGEKTYATKEFMVKARDSRTGTPHADLMTVPSDWPWAQTKILHSVDLSKVQNLLTAT